MRLFPIPSLRGLAMACAAITLAGCVHAPAPSPGALPAESLLAICGTARTGLGGTAAETRAASLQCLIAAETGYQAAARLAMVLASNGIIRGKDIGRVRDLNQAIVTQLSIAYNATSDEQRIDLAEAIGAATTQLLRIANEAAR